MDDKRIDDMRIEFLNMFADIGLGKLNQQTLSKVKSSIDYLNKKIDAMPDVKSIDDYNIIALCHQYYRLKDFYENQPSS